MTPRKPITRCPCCGQEIDDPIGFVPKVRMGPMQERLVQILRRAPDGMSVVDLADLLYANRNYAPDPHIVTVMAWHINRKINPIGLRIRSTKGPGAVYFLERTAEQCVS